MSFKIGIKAGGLTAFDTSEVCAYFTPETEGE